MKTLLLFFSIGILVFGLLKLRSFNNEFDQHKILENMKLKIVLGTSELTATLYDNATTRDFISILPVTTKLEDYEGLEKIFYPEKKLATNGVPKGYEPSKGDITYYAPWGDIAIFYKDFGYANGLVSLGKIDNNGIDLLKEATKEDVVTFELIHE